MKEDNLLMQTEEQVTEKVTIYQKIEQKGKTMLSYPGSRKRKSEQMYASISNEQCKTSKTLGKSPSSQLHRC